MPPELSVFNLFITGLNPTIKVSPFYGWWLRNYINGQLSPMKTYKS